MLHHEATCLAAGHPLRDTFARLTGQEEKAGLAGGASGIGTRGRWAQRPAEKALRSGTTSR